MLQDKDKLLEDIKKQQSVEGFLGTELTAAELDQLQRERDLLREELSQTNTQLIQCRKELASTETRLVLQHYHKSCHKSDFDNIRMTKRTIRQ